MASTLLVPSPLGERVRVRGFGLGYFRLAGQAAARDRQGVHIVQHILVRKSHDNVTSVFEITLAPHVAFVGVVVVSAIELNDQLFLKTNKIHDPRANGNVAGGNSVQQVAVYEARPK